MLSIQELLPHYPRALSTIFLVKADGISALLLGIVHGLVGLLQQLCGILAVAVKKNSADTGGCDMPHAMNLVRRIQAQQYFLPQGQGLLVGQVGLCVQFLHQNHKLVFVETNRFGIVCRTRCS